MSSVIPSRGRAAVAARRCAAEAALRSGVRVEVVDDLDRLDQARAVIDQIWRPGPEDPRFPRSLLRAMTHAGNYCAVAYDGDVALGACVGFLGVQPINSMHSQITGVLDAAAGRHVGFALKLDQRAWAVERGITSITWTFDPLVRRNAFFNLNKLHATADEYVADFYGDMTDAINVGQGTDRLLASWDLQTPDAFERANGKPAEADITRWLSSGAERVLDAIDGHPVHALGVPSSATLLVGVPADIESLRAKDPALATEWRHAVRDVLGQLMDHDWKVTAFTRDGHYVLSRKS
jgi:predicted GNAT superfamily acetyltransferase